MHHSKQFSEADKSEFILAAMVDWFKSGGSALSMDGASFEVLNGVGYVLLRYDDEVQAVYRVQPDDMLPQRMVLQPEAHLDGRHMLQ